MKKAVFFDFYNTLVRFDPPREELHAWALAQVGINVSPQALRRALPAADEFYHREALRQPPAQRGPEELKAFYAQYEARVLNGLGIEISPDLAYQVLSQVRARGWKLRLYPDVLPTLEQLRGRSLKLGVISNVDRDIRPYCQELGLDSQFSFLITSAGLGVGKPDPAIFVEALKRAGVHPFQAIHVGDTYSADVLGARGAGILGVLIDREDSYPEYQDCPRLKDLSQIVSLL